MILEIALPIPVYKTFDYLAPADVPADHSFIGCRVLVQFGPRKMVGLVVAEKDHSDSPPDKLKSVLKLVETDPVLTPLLIRFGYWLAHRTACSLGEALSALFPPGKNSKSGFVDGNSLDHPPFAPGGTEAGYQLTAGQKDAVQALHEAIFEHKPAAFLLRGVAAAGKTEVYMSAIKDALDQGKFALYLVPEIGLCVQAAEVLKQRFGANNVCVYHSDIPPKERFESWWKIKRGECPIVIGARSAMLLPVPDLGVIIVDEEQDSAYKEDRKPRFHVRDAALERARESNATVVFGSATPTLEMVEAAKEGRLTLLELEERAVGSSAPRVRVIDLKSEKTYGSLSPSLLTAIGDRLSKNQQTILFLNRRGFHRYVRCPHCNWVCRCPKCGVTLVLHGVSSPFKPKPVGKAGRAKPQVSAPAGAAAQLTCHYCTSHYPAPTACPDCGQKKLFSGGVGTQRVEEEIKEKFPWAKVARWDRDSAIKMGTHEKIFEEFREGNLDILIGTQLVAQGFNFPKVTLVGVVDADAPLHIPDFRAAEHAFQLLTQVAGRAGRELVTGEVLVQTRQPDHYAIQLAARMDFSGFSEQELRFRNDLNYPPFSHLAIVKTTSKNEARLEADMNRFLDWINQLDLPEPVGILGPSVSRRKKKGLSSQQVLLKIPTAEFESFLEKINAFLAENHARFWVDIDPI